MEPKDILGVLTPSLLFIFAATFIFIWKSNKEQFHSRCLAMAFSLNAIGFSAVWLLNDYAPRAALLGCGVFAMGSMVFFARGILLRLSISVPYRLFIGLQIINIICSVIALYVYDSVFAILTLTGIISGLQTAIIAYKLQKKAEKNPINMTTVWVMALVAVLIPARMMSGYLTATNPLTIETYQSSVEWISLHLLVIVLSTMGALTFILYTLNQAMAAVQMQADTDELTGLARRGRFEQNAKRIFAQEKRTPLPVSLIVMDIDNFKSVNDKHGHLAGDAVLAQVGDMLKTSSRETDIIGRIGGEEFAILLWNADIKGARLVAETLRTSMENCDFGDLLDGENCTASFGVAQLEQGESYKQLFDLADRALYRAKNTGRNRVNAATFILEEAA
ncbi:MAG: GGDEF domain-containing protein [Rhizobiaceae bacterium]